MLDLVSRCNGCATTSARFGGDPSNVMIFGESGGGAKVSVPDGDAGAKGLFHRAAVQSGPGLRVETRENAAKRASTMFAELASRLRSSTR